MARDSELQGGLNSLGLSLGFENQTGKRERSTLYHQSYSSSLREVPPVKVSY